MSKTYEKIEIEAINDDVKVVYQGLDYIPEYENSKITVELSIDELDSSDQDPDEPILYLIEIESVDAEFLIEVPSFFPVSMSILFATDILFTLQPNNKGNLV